MKYHIQFGSKKIDFEISYSNRKTLGISVNPNMEVLVKAPLGGNIHKIRSIVRKKNSLDIKAANLFYWLFSKISGKKIYQWGISLLYGEAI